MKTKTLAQSRSRSYGLVTRFSPSHIAQFWRDWTSMLGYRSADQNGGQFVTLYWNHME